MVFLLLQELFKVGVSEASVLLDSWDSWLAAEGEGVPLGADTGAAAVVGDSNGLLL